MPVQSFLQKPFSARMLRKKPKRLLNQEFKKILQAIPTTSQHTCLGATTVIFILNSVQDCYNSWGKEQITKINKILRSPTTLLLNQQVTKEMNISE